MHLTFLPVAEYFRDAQGQDVLLFIDNIFRFTQAGSEVLFCVDKRVLSQYNDDCLEFIFWFINTPVRL